MQNFLALLLFAFAVPSFAEQVTGITDGDTLTVMHDRKPLKIRLANIDAPEKMQAFWERSRKSLSDMCLHKDANYTVQGLDRNDGLKVAVVNCAGVEVSRAQVNRGMAWVYFAYNKDADLPAVQAQARAVRRGLWIDANPIPPWTFRQQKKAK